MFEAGGWRLVSVLDCYLCISFFVFGCTVPAEAREHASTGLKMDGSANKTKDDDGDDDDGM